MQISKFVLATFLASAGSLAIYAQTTSDQQNRALEVLRKQIAEERRKTTGEAPKEKTPAPILEMKNPQPSETKVEQPKAAEEKPAPAPETAEPAETPAQKRAMEALHKAIEQEKGSKSTSAMTPTPGKMESTERKPSAKPSKSDESKVTEPKEKKRNAKTAPAKKTEVIETTPPPVIAEKPAPAGPKTKQEKLAELLDEYKADKITPQQYHEQRAKILTEP